MKMSKKKHKLKKSKLIICTVYIIMDYFKKFSELPRLEITSVNRYHSSLCHVWQRAHEQKENTGHTYKHIESIQQSQYTSIAMASVY